MSTFIFPGAKFVLGNLVITPAAHDAVGAERSIACLQRHVVGDWGVIDEHDIGVNNAGLEAHGRLMSVYPINEAKQEADDNRVWIITEADRSCTTVLLPEDY